MSPNMARLAAVVVLASGISWETALADTMTGSLVFGSDPTTFGNRYDPANPNLNSTFFPSGISNTNSPTVTLVGGTTAKFGYQDVFNTDTAGFTAGQLDIKDVVAADFGIGAGADSWTQTFTASTPGFFNGWTLLSSNFDPATLAWSLSNSNTTLTVTWGGTDPGFDTLDPLTFDAIFTSSSTPPVPGPIVGAGLPGLALALGGILAWRRRKREMA